jgi:hypothetical protein
MKCHYRYCNREINFGRPDRKFCNKNCKSKEVSLKKELKSLNMRALKTKDFIERSKIKHNNKYEYDLTIYVNCRTKVKITCPTHGVFEQTPDGHLCKSYGCEKCARDAHKLISLSPERIEKIKKIHNNKYLYNDLSINKGFINIICPDHGIFTQYLYFHEYGHGCSECNSSSRGENYIKNYLNNKNINYYRNYIFDDCKNKRGLRFDFYLYDILTIIEYDGEHHFMENKYFGEGNLDYVKKNDEIKNKYCEDNNIILIRIPYYNFDKIDIILDSYLDFKFRSIPKL